MGHEQRGRRPALVVSNNIFNHFSRMAIVCPVTHTDKNHPFHVKLNYQTATKGVILCDQVRTLDVYAREAELIEQLPDDEVLDIITGFFAIAEINAV